MEDLYVVWTSTATFIGKVEGSVGALMPLAAQVKLVDPVMFMERPDQQGRVQIAVGPMLMSISPPFVYVRWVMCVPLSECGGDNHKLAEVYHTTVSQLRARRSGIVIANPGQVPPLRSH